MQVLPREVRGWKPRSLTDKSLIIRYSDFDMGLPLYKPPPLSFTEIKASFPTPYFEIAIDWPCFAEGSKCAIGIRDIRFDRNSRNITTILRESGVFQKHMSISSFRGTLVNTDYHKCQQHPSLVNFTRDIHYRIEIDLFNVISRIAYI